MKETMDIGKSKLWGRKSKSNEVKSGQYG
jgi:hypothetical protein